MRLTQYATAAFAAVAMYTAYHPALAQFPPFRFAPEQYQTVICFPDDWLKTMVDECGGLSYDFGPGPYARPLTQIHAGTERGSLKIERQYLEDPLTPIITTVLKGNSDTVRLTSFALPPDTMIPFPSTAVWDRGRIRRVSGVNGCIGWSMPPDSIDPAFRNAAWGNNRPILYRVAVEPGSRHQVAMGFCEPYKPRAGLRLLELRVEGSHPHTMDPMASGVRNTPVVVMLDGHDADRDGWLNVECHSGGPDPNVFLNGFWVFRPGETITTDQILSGEGSRRSWIHHRCGTELEQLAPVPRADGIIAEYSGGSPRPQITIRTRRPLVVVEPDPGNRTGHGAPVLSSLHNPDHEPQPYLFSTPSPSAVVRTAEGWRLEYPPATTRVEITVVHGNHGPRRLTKCPDLTFSLAAARDSWRSTSLPRPMLVPDSTIQLVLDAGIRTIYQVREKVDGILQFQPGPSVYRGLWIADAMLTGIPVAMLGDTAALREYLDTGLRNQLSNGQVRSLFPAVSIVETPTWAFTAFWLARSTGDRSWIRRHWPAMRSALDWICGLREQTLGDPSRVNAGLVPAGFVDGGISEPMPDYGTLWWCMVALDEGIRAAESLGETTGAARWKATLAGFTFSFATAGRRDLLTDRYGNRFLPVGVADTATSRPQCAQLSLFGPARFASFVDRPGSFADSVARLNLVMMESYRSQGLYRSTGWLAEGIWPWLGGYLGMIHQRIGDPTRAVDLLYAYADHAAPTGVWVEEQLPRGSGSGTTGDVSNAEASAVFVHLVRYLLVTERKDGLELLRGLPERWLKPGAVIALHGILTEFGPLTLELRVGAGSAHLTVGAVDGRGAPGGPYLTTSPLRRAGFGGVDGKPLPDRVSWKWGDPFTMELRWETSR